MSQTTTLLSEKNQWPPLPKRVFVRTAVVNDLDWLVQELKLFSDFYKTKHPLFGHEQFVREGMVTMIEKHLVLIAEKEGVGPIGFIAGLLVPHIFNPLIRCLTEAFWWVKEEFRSSRAGYLLLMEFIEFGKQNADWILCTIEEHSPINQEALTDRGFKLKERNYIMEVN